MTLAEGVLTTEYRRGIGTPQPVRPNVSQRDMDVMTALVQWLGTACGLGMLRDCQREIDKQELERRESQTGWFDLNAMPDHDADRSRIEAIARQIANDVGKTEDHRGHAFRMLKQAMSWAWKSGQLAKLEEVNSGGSDDEVN